MTVRPLACQEQAARFATTRDDAETTAARIRANGILDALALLRAGLPDSAYAVVMRSFEAQAHVLGLHLHETEATPPPDDVIAEAVRAALGEVERLLLGKSGTTYELDLQYRIGMNASIRIVREVRDRRAPKTGATP